MKKKINFQNYKAVIFTSSNAIKFLNVDKFDSKIKCYCVGKTTEFAARQAGFLNTFSSEGTVDSLIELIIRSFENKSGKLLYLSSEFISKDLDIDLIITKPYWIYSKQKNNLLILEKEIDERVEKLICNSFKKKSKIKKIYISDVNKKNLDINDLTSDHRHYKSTIIQLIEKNQFCL